MSLLVNSYSGMTLNDAVCVTGGATGKRGWAQTPSSPLLALRMQNGKNWEIYGSNVILFIYFF